jgi:hypothetical protein
MSVFSITREGTLKEFPSICSMAQATKASATEDASLDFIAHNTSHVLEKSA